MSRIVLSLATIFLGAHAQAADTLPKDVQAFVEAHCVRCHGEKKSRGHVNFVPLLKEGADVGHHFKTWKAAAARISSLEMPPGGEPQPTDDERSKFADWFKSRIPKEASPAPFRVRRLSTQEYRRYVESLLGFALNVQKVAGSLETSMILRLMPPDPRGPSGYTNDTSNNPISPNLWHNYTLVADAAVAKLFSPEGRKALEAYTGPLKKNEIDKAQAQQLLDQFQANAWRRPIADKDRQHHADLVRDVSPATMPPVLKRELKRNLMSPEFLYRGFLAERSPGKVAPVDDHELAERLSDFLWADFPDKELVDLAASRKLTEAKTLEAQVRRMLQSPKARALSEIFSTEWLHLDEIDNIAQEPAFAETLKRQPIELLHYLIANDRPLQELFDNRIEFVNQYLVNYYVADGAQFPKARKQATEAEKLPLFRIDLTNTKGRGGLLTMPGILSMNKTPIQRGAWVLTRLLGEPLGEPPADVPAIKPPQPGAAVSFRERFVEHRANKACASCHDRTDPLGFAFEAYNENGGDLFAANVAQQRIVRMGPQKTGKAPKLPKIDASGVLPTGEKFNDFEEFKAVLTTKLWPRVVENVVRQTLAYANCRELEAGDERVVEELTTRMSRPGATWQDLILGVVNSVSFRQASFPADDSATPKKR